MIALEQVLENIGVGRYHFLQTFLLGGLRIVDGAEMMVCSSILGALQESWHISNAMKGVMMSMIFVGVAIGGLVGGRLADIFGRRLVIVYSFMGEVVIGALTATARGPGVMLMNRFCTGFCFGAGVPSVTALVLESAPAVGGKRLLNLGTCWFGIGEVYAATLLYFYMPTLSDPTDSAWRMVVLLAIVPAAILFPAAALTLQESPSWLCAYGKKREALSVLKFIANFNRNEEVVQDLQDVDPFELHSLLDESSGLLSQSEGLGTTHGSASFSAREPEPEDEGLEPLPASSRTAPVAPLAKLTALQLLTYAEFRWTLVSGAWLCFVANFLYYGTSYLLPQIFRSLGKTTSPAVQLLIAASATFPGVALGDMLLLCRKLTDRDRLVILSAAVGTVEVTLAHLRLDNPRDAKIMLVLFFLLRVGVTAFFSCAYIFIGRVFPSACRCTAMSFCITGGRVGSICAPLIIELMARPGGGENFVFLFCTLLCILTMLVIRFCLGEYDYVEKLPEGEAAGPETVKQGEPASPQHATSTSSDGQPPGLPTASLSILQHRASRRLSGGLAQDLPAARLETLSRASHPLSSAQRASLP